MGEDFGLMVRRLRRAAGLTQEQLAVRADLSVRTISDVECGRIVRPFQRSVRRLAEALGLEGAAAEAFMARARPATDSAAPGVATGRQTPDEAGSGKPGLGETGSGGRREEPSSRERPNDMAPRQLPAAVPHFVGRTRELEALTRLLDGSGQPLDALVISVIGGMPGVGKTALAIHMKQALALEEALGDHSGQANIHHATAMLFERQRQFTDALHHERIALDLYRTADYRAGQARALNAIGWFNAMLNRHEQALTSCEQALELARQIQSPDIEATILDSLGYAHHHLGHYAEAITHYERALQLFESTGERYYQAAILAHLGETHRAVEHITAAREAWQQALNILDDLEHPDADHIRTKLTDMTNNVER